MGQVRADPSAFGAGVAQATGQLGEAAFNIGNAIYSRQNAINAARDLQGFDEQMLQGLQALQDTEDMTDPAVVDKFRQSATQAAKDVVANHRGNSESRARLQMQVENQASQYTKAAISAQVKAQQKFIADRIDQKANELAISGAYAPQEMDNLFKELDADIDLFADGMSSSLASEYKTAGRSRIVTSTINALLEQGNWQAAQQMLKNPNVGKYLQPDTARRFAIGTAVEEGKAVAEQKRQDRNVSAWTQRVGRNLTPEEVLKVRALPEKKNMTVADQLVEYELITGKPAPQNVVDQFYKLDGASGGANMFGNSLQGRALSFVTENAVAYANGMLSPEQARTYEASVAEAYKPVMRPNPVTGQIEEIRPTIPNFVTQATEQGSRFYGGGALTSQSSSGQAMPGQTVQLTDASGRVIGQSVVGPNGTWTIRDQNPPSGGGGAAGGPQPAPQDEPTIWEMAGDLAGPVPAVKAGVGDIPFIGSMVEGGGQTASNRAYVKTQVSQMVDALSINPRNPVALVEMIRKEIDVDPKVFGDPAAYRKRIEGVNRSLTERLIEETAAGQDPNLPARTRQDALDVANTIRNFQQKLMPPQVKNRQELESLGLPSGSKFIDPNGVLRRVP